MNTENEIIANNIKRLKDDSNLASYSSLAKKSHVSVPTITNFIRYPDEKNMTVNVLAAIAKATNIATWMLLIKDFPFKKSREEQVLSISSQGYTVLHTFESASDEAKIAILDQMEFLIERHDKNHKKSLLIHNERVKLSYKE